MKTPSSADSPITHDTAVDPRSWIWPSLSATLAELTDAQLDQVTGGAVQKVREAALVPGPASERWDFVKGWPIKL